MSKWIDGQECKSLQLKYCELVLYKKVNGEYFACINNNNTNILSLRTYDEIDAKYEALKKFENWIMEDIEKKKKTLLELRNLRWTKRNGNPITIKALNELYFFQNKHYQEDVGIRHKKYK